jgi:Fe-S oxidoreductase
LGDLDRAEEFATRNVALFREITRDGSEILTLEPASAICVKREYPYFCSDADAEFVYANTTDVATYLARLLRSNEFNRGALRSLAPDRKLTIAYHAPCRSLALSRAALYATTPTQTLLNCIPDAEIRRVERGCCGFAGYSGFTKRRFSESLRIGGRLLLEMRDPEFDYCVSECSFCNLQIAQSGVKPVIHALKLLAVSYGILTLEEAELKTI